MQAGKERKVEGEQSNEMRPGHGFDELLEELRVAVLRVEAFRLLAREQHFLLHGHLEASLPDLREDRVCSAQHMQRTRAEPSLRIRAGSLVATVLYYTVLSSSLL